MRKIYKKRKGGYMPPEPENNDDDVPTLEDLQNRLARLQEPENNRNIERDQYPQQIDPRRFGLNEQELAEYERQLEEGNRLAYQNRLQHEGRQGPFTRIDDDNDSLYGDHDDDDIEPYDEDELERRIAAFNNDRNVQQGGRRRKLTKKKKTVRRIRRRKTTRKHYKKRKK